MIRAWPTGKLGELLERSEETIEPIADVEYREITVRLWGNGIAERRAVLGAELTGRRFVAHAGQFIVSRIDARNGATGLIPASLEGALVTNDFPLFDVNRDRLEPVFLSWLAKTKAFVELCQRASEGTTNRVRLKEDRFYALEIPLPSLAEQRRLVARIEELAAQIEEARALRHRTSEEADALFEQARAEIFELAGKRGTQPLSDAATLERGKFSHRPRNDPRFFGGAHPWIQIGEIEASRKYITQWHETLNDAGLSISEKFPKGTVLISIAATIGAVGILDFDCCVPDSIVGITPTDGNDSEFLYHYLGYIRTHLEAVAPQSAQKNINLQVLAPLPVPRVTLREQHRIVAALDDLEAEMDKLKRFQAETAAELDALLPSILDRAFRGEL